MSNAIEWKLPYNGFDTLVGRSREDSYGTKLHDSDVLVSPERVSASLWPVVGGQNNNSLLVAGQHTELLLSQTFFCSL